MKMKTKMKLKFKFKKSEKKNGWHPWATIHGPLFIFIFCLHVRLFKRAFNQDRAVKRVYTVFTTVNSPRHIFIQVIEKKFH